MVCMTRALLALVLAAAISSSARAQAPAAPSTPVSPDASPAPPPSAPAEAPPGLAPPAANWTPPPTGYLTPPPPELAPSDPGYRSPTTALTLSLGFTAAGYGLSAWARYRMETENGTQEASTSTAMISTVGAIFALVGPTTGHIYAGKTWNPGLKWRLITLATFTVTGIFFIGAALSETDNDGTVAVLAIGVLASGLGYLGATVYEVATAPSAASEHNRRRSGTTITVAPTLGRAPGLAVVGTF